jgi:hypothetical protein
MSESTVPKCAEIFDGGIENSRELIRGLSALMGDVALKRVVPGEANAICNAAGKILTTVNLQYKYGAKDSGEPTLSLASPAPSPPTIPRGGSASGRSLEAPRARMK